MASETYYVDELLKAEEQANKIIKAAQKLREERLKEARLSAEEEIERYRQQKEAKFRELQERKQDREYEHKLKATTDHQIEQIRSDFTRNKDRVIGMLVKNVLSVDLEIPISIKEKFTKKDLRSDN